MDALLKQVKHILETFLRGEKPPKVEYMNTHSAITDECNKYRADTATSSSSNPYALFYTTAITCFRKNAKATCLRLAARASSPLSSSPAQVLEAYSNEFFRYISAVRDASRMLLYVDRNYTSKENKPDIGSVAVRAWRDLLFYSHAPTLSEALCAAAKRYRTSKILAKDIKSIHIVSVTFQVFATDRELNFNTKEDKDLEDDPYNAISLQGSRPRSYIQYSRLYGSIYLAELREYCLKEAAIAFEKGSPGQYVDWVFRTKEAELSRAMIFLGDDVVKELKVDELLDKAMVASYSLSLSEKFPSLLEEGDIHGASKLVALASRSTYLLNRMKPAFIDFAKNKLRIALDDVVKNRPDDPMAFGDSVIGTRIELINILTRFREACTLEARQKLDTLKLEAGLNDVFEELVNNNPLCPDSTESSSEPLGKFMDTAVGVLACNLEDVEAEGGNEQTKRSYIDSFRAQIKESLNLVELLKEKDSFSLFFEGLIARRVIAGFERTGVIMGVEIIMNELNANSKACPPLIQKMSKFQADITGSKEALDLFLRRKRDRVGEAMDTLQEKLTQYSMVSEGNSSTIAKIGLGLLGAFSSMRKGGNNYGADSDLPSGVKEFLTPGGDDENELKFKLDFMVISKGQWHLPAAALELDSYAATPSEVVPVQEEFTKFYVSEHKERKLRWLPTLAHGCLEASCYAAAPDASEEQKRSPKYTFVTTGFQMVIFLAFNEKNVVGMRELLDKWKVPEVAAKANVTMLVKHRLLMMKPANALTLDSKLAINKKFFNRRDELVLVPSDAVVRKIIQQKKEGKDAPKRPGVAVKSNVLSKMPFDYDRLTPQEKETLDESRIYAARAVVTGIAKKLKTVDVVSILSEARKELPTEFWGSESLVKEQIEWLVDNGILDRDDSDASVFHYIP